MSLLMLTGASGAGKTTIAEAVQDRYRDRVEVFFFDSIGVPSLEEFARLREAGVDWQREKTIEWLKRLAAHKTDQPILFEGSTRLSYLREAAELAGLTEAKIMLIDCDDATRTARLHGPRGQPELANESMANWARYLREQAREFGCEIWDTSARTIEESVAQVARRMGLV
jgi:adenylate kinase family enzyme